VVHWSVLIRWSVAFGALSDDSHNLSRQILRKQLRFPEIAVTHPPDTFWLRGVWPSIMYITTTRFDGHHPTDKIQRAAQKSASSTGGGPSGEFGAMNSPRAGPNTDPEPKIWAASPVENTPWEPNQAVRSIPRGHGTEGLPPSWSQPPSHGGYGRNTTGGWLADDPRVVPFRPRACGGVVLGLVYRSPQ
jgi:hypothetical protein